MNDNTVKKPTSTLDIITQETNTQNEAVMAGDLATRKKFGPAAMSQAGNPTSGGGINRPTKGQA